ncbi:unnamed protein product, partial [Didymodactylos carnosus]
RFLDRDKPKIRYTDTIFVRGIDFSSWLKKTVKPEDFVHVKVSMPGNEVILLEKILYDNNLILADKWEIEWSDRSNLYLTPTRIYIQMMIESHGFDSLYFTTHTDIKKVYEKKLPFVNVTKYYSWSVLNDTDVQIHYVQRPEKPPQKVI